MSLRVVDDVAVQEEDNDNIEQTNDGINLISTKRNTNNHDRERQQQFSLGNVFNGFMNLISGKRGNRNGYGNVFDEQLSSDEMDELLETNDDDMVPSSKAISVFNHHVLYSIYGFNVDPDKASEYRVASEWERVPQDVLLIVFSFLPYESLIMSISQVSKEWFFLSQQNILWEKFFLQQLFPSKHSKFLFSSFQGSKYLPEIDKKENLLESIQSRFYIPLFDPTPNNTDNSRFEGEVEDEKRKEIKLRIEGEIEDELEDKFQKNHYNLKTILGDKTVSSVGSELNRYEREFYTLLHAPYICSFYKLCFQKLNNFVSTATRQVETHNKSREKLENVYEMCHSTQYYFTYFFGVPISTASATLCLILQVIKMNVDMFNIEANNPNAIDGYWVLPFAFLYPPLFCGIIVLAQQFTKAYLRFKLKSRQTAQGVLVVLIGLIFMFGLTGFFFMVNLSCIFPLPPKYLGDDVPGIEDIKFYAFKRIVNNYSFVMSPFLVAFLLIAVSTRN